MARLMIRLMALAGFASLALGAACGDDDETVTREDRERLEERVEDRMREFGAKIEDLERERERQGGGVRAEIDEQLEQLREERRDLDRRLDRLRTSTDEKWRGLKDDIEDSLNDFEKELDDLERELF